MRQLSTQHGDRRHIEAFSIVEALVGVTLMGILFVSLYTGLSSGFGIVQSGRENQRATQILLEKMETIRLYSWEQINTDGFIPTNFTEPFAVQTNETEEATDTFYYYGTLTVENAPISESYSNEMRLITVSLNWTNGAVPRHREMQTFVARHGLQNYIY
jgi:type II secretory pathway pseudopilin PulG